MEVWVLGVSIDTPPGPSRGSTEIEVEEAAVVCPLLEPVAVPPEFVAWVAVGAFVVTGAAAVASESGRKGSVRIELTWTSTCHHMTYFVAS